MKAIDIVLGMKQAREIVERETPTMPEDQRSKIINALAEAGRLINLCPVCTGLKKTLRTHPNGGGYVGRPSKNGKLYFEYPCRLCDGAGQVLRMKCGSCLSEFEPHAAPRPGEYSVLYPVLLCDTCFETVEAKVSLIEPESAKPEKKRN